MTSFLIILQASCIALNVATSMKPVFDEYNPELLKSLSYDEKLAEIAARQSGGRPTYCDNRYYRAVANGGQGKQAFQSASHFLTYLTVVLLL
jgi:hypothetical protein